MKHGLLRFISLSAVMLIRGAACASAPLPAAPTPALSSVSAQQNRAPGEYLVTLAPDTDSKAISEVYGQFGIKGIKDLGRNNFLVKLTNDPGSEAMEELRSKDIRIKAIQPNFVYHMMGPGKAQ